MANGINTYPSTLVSHSRSHFHRRGLPNFPSERFIPLILSFLLLLYESSYFITINNFLLPELGKKVSLLGYDKLHSELMLDYLEIISYWGYIVVPLIILLKLAALTFFVQLSFLLNSIVLGYKRIFNVIVWAGTVLALGECVRVLKIYFTLPQLRHSESFQFFPFGFINLMNTDLYDPAFLVLLNYLNIFELGWFIMVLWGLSQIKKIKKTEVFSIVGSIWVLIVLLNWGLAFYFSEIGALLL